MAKNTPSKPQSQWSEITYIRCELDKQQKIELEKWLKASKHDWFAYIESAINSNLRFAVHEDSYHRCVEARLTLLSQSTGINTLVLQGRGPDMSAAIQALFYKHLIVLEQDWESLDHDQENSRYSDWG